MSPSLSLVGQTLNWAETKTERELTKDGELGVKRLFGEVHVNDELPGFTLTITRTDFVRMAGAGGRFNPLHYSDEYAQAQGWPDKNLHFGGKVIGTRQEEG